MKRAVLEEEADGEAAPAPWVVRVVDARGDKLDYAQAASLIFTLNHAAGAMGGATKPPLYNQQ